MFLNNGNDQIEMMSYPLAGIHAGDFTYICFRFYIRLAGYLLDEKNVKDMEKLHD